MDFARRHAIGARRATTHAASNLEQGLFRFTATACKRRLVRSITCRSCLAGAVLSRIFVGANRPGYYALKRHVSVSGVRAHPYRLVSLERGGSDRFVKGFSRVNS